jgi:hypothetical protein
MKTFFAVRLSTVSSSIQRFALYTHDPVASHGTHMDAVWPLDSHDANRRKIKLLPFQVDSSRKKYPRFHFAIQRGTGGLDRLAHELADHYKEQVTIELLEGGNPSTFTSPKV